MLPDRAALTVDQQDRVPPSSFLNCCVDLSGPHRLLLLCECTNDRDGNPPRAGMPGGDGLLCSACVGLPRGSRRPVVAAHDGRESRVRWNLLVLPSRLMGHERSEDYAWPEMDLLRRSRAHEEFERFAAVQADELIRTAYLMVGDRGDAEDIVQECLLRVARKWPRVRKMQHPGAYARRVMVNLVLDGRHKRARRTLELATIAPETAQPAVSLDDRADLIRALRDLSPRQRAVLVLRYFCDLPEAEVATIIGCSVGTVKSSASRALAQLRLALVDSSPETPDTSEQHAARSTLR